MEIYQTKNYASESPTSAEQLHHSAAGVPDHQMNANRSASPQGPQSWTSPQHSNTQHQTHQQQRAPDPARVHQSDHNLGEFQFNQYIFKILPVFSKFSMYLVVLIILNLCSVYIYTIHILNRYVCLSEIVGNDNVFVIFKKLVQYLSKFQTSKYMRWFLRKKGAIGDPTYL